MNGTITSAPESLDSSTVGDIATHCIYTDRRAGFIVKKTDTRIVWQEAKATLLNGSGSGAPDALTFTPGGFCGHMSGRQRWEIESDPEGETVTFSRRTRKDGSEVWKMAGHPTRSPGHVLIAGESHHYDFNL
jgi:hypothetical protein